MELKRRWDARVVFTIVYFVCFVAYLLTAFWPAEAKTYAVSSHLVIPSITLSSDVTSLELVEGKLETPDTIVGSFSKAKNKTLLIGHSSTVFTGLKNVKLGDELVYANNKYIIVASEVLLKTDINMDKLLRKAARDTIVIMTCAGEDLGHGDSTHRLILTAIRQ